MLMILTFFQTEVKPIDQVKINLSEIFPNAAGLPQTNHPKSTQNSEDSSYYQCVRTEELLRSFPLATTHVKVVNSGKVVIDRYRMRYFFKKERRYCYRY